MEIPARGANERLGLVYAALYHVELALNRRTDRRIRFVIMIGASDVAFMIPSASRPRGLTGRPLLRA